MKTQFFSTVVVTVMLLTILSANNLKAKETELKKEAVAVSNLEKLAIELENATKFNVNSTLSVAELSSTTTMPEKSTYCENVTDIVTNNLEDTNIRFDVNRTISVTEEVNNMKGAGISNPDEITEMMLGKIKYDVKMTIAMQE